MGQSNPFRAILDQVTYSLVNAFAITKHPPIQVAKASPAKTNVDHAVTLENVVNHFGRLNPSSFRLMISQTDAPSMLRKRLMWPWHAKRDLLGVPLQRSARP